MIRTTLATLACALFAAGAARAAGDDSIPHGIAGDVIAKTVELVEKKAVYPRRQAEYDAAKRALLAILSEQPGAVDRTELHARIGRLLATLDADGHSFITPPPPTQSRWFNLVTTRHGVVLQFVPPAITGWGDAINADYLKRYHEEAALRPDLGQACALVVDLRAQTGGNGWPPFIAMTPLFNAGNRANYVTRDGRRIPVVSRAFLDSLYQRFGGGLANPLAQFADAPPAVLVGKNTASAGEMLLVGFLGEARVQTFGDTSYGLTTANSTNTLPDGSILTLTEARYALGDEPVFRGGIPAMHSGAGPDAAAEWAAANSPRCKAN